MTLDTMTDLLDSAMDLRPIGVCNGKPEFTPDDEPVDWDAVEDVLFSYEFPPSQGGGSDTALPVKRVPFRAKVKAKVETKTEPKVKPKVKPKANK